MEPSMVSDVNCKESDGGDLFDGLLQKFSCLRTEDKDVLIREFQMLISPNELSPVQCAFFLDMNNWNLQQAICSYFDFDAPQNELFELPRSNFIQDVTIGEGEEVPPNTKFIKTWTIENPGPQKWPVCFRRFINGHQMGSCARVMVNSLEPGERTNVSVEMTSPESPGIYQGQWRMFTMNGNYFGEVIWVILTVAEGGLLGLTQQMNSFHQLGSPLKSRSSESVEIHNPFASLSTARSSSAASSPYQPSYLSSVNTFHQPTTNEATFHQQQQLSSERQAMLVNPFVDNQHHEESAVNNQSSNHNRPTEEGLPPTPTPSEDMML